MIGETISHYEILEKIGEGGMGAVYKALDTTLDRHVAIKFLPPHLRSDEDARKRFVYEAKAASALNHFNIAVVHEIDETPEGQMFIVMACYDGLTLKGKQKDGPLSPGEAIDIGIQVAEGLSKAHEAGIVHRDIKPANILMTSDGVAKIVDFGIAKLSGMTMVTKAGMTLGTVAYMSPEQASGRGIDARTDVFSLGVVLYELLTGHLPFPGEHEAAVLYGIMNTEPESMSEYRSDITEPLQSVISRALSKDPDERYQNVTEFRDDLEQIENDFTEVKRSHRRTPAQLPHTLRRFKKRTVIILAASVLILGMAAVFLVPRLIRSPELLQPSPRITPLVTGKAFEGTPQWSPVGNMIAFEAKKDGVWDVWISDLDGAHSLNLTSNPNSTDRSPAWSPDGQSIAFYSDRGGPGIYTMTATGGSVRRIVDVKPILVQESLLHLRWVEGDRLIFGDLDGNMRGDTYEFNLGDQSLRCLTSSQPDGAYLGELSPSGEFLVFRRPLQGSDVDVFVLGMENGDIHQISLPAREISWAPDGESLFLISTLEGNWDLWTVAIDSHSGVQKGEPRRLTTAVSLSDISFSPTGDRAVASLSSSKSDLWVFPTNAGPITSLDLGEQVSTGPSLKNHARWMPDGRSIVYNSDRRGEMQIWIQETGSGQPIRLNDEPGLFPIVSPDSRWIAYNLRNEGYAFNTQVVRPDGSDLHPMYSELPEEYEFIVSLDWSNDGRHIVYHTKIKDEWLLGVATIDLETGTASKMGIIGVRGSIPFWSPDGKHLVYQQAEDDMPNLYVSTVDGEKTYRLTDDPEQEWLAGWSANPSFIYYGRMKENGDKDVYRIAMDDDGRPKSDPELWMAFPGSIRLSQFLDFHADRAIGAIYEAKSDICLIEFEKTASR